MCGCLVISHRCWTLSLFEPLSLNSRSLRINQTLYYLTFSSSTCHNFFFTPFLILYFSLFLSFYFVHPKVTWLNCAYNCKIIILLFKCNLLFLLPQATYFFIFFSMMELQGFKPRRIFIFFFFLEFSFSAETRKEYIHFDEEFKKKKKMFKKFLQRILRIFFCFFFQFFVSNRNQITWLQSLET